jgi:hypothetical protein
MPLPDPIEPSAEDASTMPPPPAREPDLDDDFADGPSARWWVPHYLPHWTTPDRSAARHRTTPTGLELRIEEEQLDWRPEDAPMRVSNLQTGVAASGPVGSTLGMHRHRDDGLVVRTRTVHRMAFAPARGRVDVTVSASRDDGCMLAAWLVGTEADGPDDSGELYVFEIDGSAVGARSIARSGIKAHRDPRLTTDMREVAIPFDAGERHTWTVAWDAGGTLIGCEGRVVRRLAQAPGYPLVLMLDLFELGEPRGAHPKTALVHRVRGWSD